MRTKRAVRRQAFRRQAVGSPTGILVASWEDDPGDPKSQPPLSPLSVPVPVPSALLRVRFPAVVGLCKSFLC